MATTSITKHNCFILGLAVYSLTNVVIFIMAVRPTFPRARETIRDSKAKPNITVTSQTPEERPPRRIVLLTSNHAYVDMLENLLLSIEKTGTRPSVTVIAEDGEAFKRLSANPYPKLNVTKSKLTPMPRRSAKAFRFRTQDFNTFTRRRPKYILDFLLQGYEVFFLDADTFWFRDPFPYFRGDFDVAFFKDVPAHLFNAGTAYYKQTPSAISLVKEWVRLARQETKKYDQEILNDIIESRKIPGLIVKVLSQEFFPNGVTFYRRKKKCLNDTSKVVVFHSTWSGTHDMKVRLYKRCGLWLKK